MSSQQFPFYLGQWGSGIRGVSCSEWRPNGMVRAADRETGKKKGGGRKSSVARKPISAALLFPFLTPCAMHHSAKRGSVERNLQRSHFYPVRRAPFRLRRQELAESPTIPLPLHSPRTIPPATAGAGGISNEHQSPIPFPSPNFLSFNRKNLFLSWNFRQRKICLYYI